MTPESLATLGLSTQPGYQNSPFGYLFYVQIFRGDTHIGGYRVNGRGEFTWGRLHGVGRDYTKAWAFVAMVKATI